MVSLFGRLLWLEFSFARRKIAARKSFIKEKRGHIHYDVWERC